MVDLRSAAAKLRPLVIAVLLVFIGSMVASAQFDTGTISGIVTDSSGAVIPRATVNVTNSGTSFQKTLQTDNGGNYTASALPSGNYVVTANAGNFAEAKSQQLVLNVGATVHVNLTMNVAAANQSIEVTGTTTTVDTASSTAGTTLYANQIANLPTNGRDLMDFLEIAPGSVNSTGFFQGSVNGQENFLTGLNVMVDGQSATRGDINGFTETEGNEQARLTRSSVDSVQEIDFANSGYNAQVGHSLGPQMNIAMQPVLAQMAPLPAGCTAIPAPTSCAVSGTDELDPITGLPDGNGAQLVYDPAALPTTLREDSGSARIDYNFSDKDRIFFR